MGSQSEPKQAKAVSQPAPATAAPRAAAVEPAPRWSAGNQALARLFRQARGPRPAATPLPVSEPGDPLEREADRIAEQVMRMPDGPAAGPVQASPAPPALQAKCASCQEEEEQLRRKAVGDAGPLAPPAVHEVLRSPGRPLGAEARAFFEPRFGRDLSGVEVHDGPDAARSAEAVQARAYTVGDAIVFNTGEFAPGTQAGRHLLAHELTHVVQQGSGPRLQRQDDGGAGSSDQNQSVTAEELDRQYRAAVAGYDWRLAAEKLNAFNRDDIQARLTELTRDQIDNIHQGALDNPKVGPDSQVAQMTQPAAPPANAPPAPGAGAPPAAPAAGAGPQPAPQGEVASIIAALQEPQENGVGNYPEACGILDGMWIVSMFQTLEEVRNRGYFDLLRGGVCPNMPRVGIAVDAVIAKSSPPVTWQFASAHPAFADLPDQQKQEVATYLALPWPMPIDASAGTDQGGLTDNEKIFVGVLVVGALVVGGALLLATPVGQAIVLGTLIAAAPVGETAAVVGAPVAVEIAAGSFAAEATGAVALGGGSAAASSAAAPVLVTTLATAPTAAGTTATAVASSSWAATAAQTILATGVTAATLSSDNPPKPDEDPKTKTDSCQDMLRLAPGINDRWHIQRPAIQGQTTVLSAAFRLDAGIAPPPGQDTDTPQRQWVRAIGLPADDAGHVIANLFGGTNAFNSPDGNIFPQDLSFNRGTMRSYDAVVARLHDSGCDVCVNIGLIYDSDTALRPSALLYTYLYRSVGATGFNPPISALVPNP